ncbi:MAG: RiPP maturation radical SAM protein 1, partial [bacterium]|nr:RiPP maturation radical SAM protein 1 [bacterium]
MRDKMVDKGSSVQVCLVAVPYFSLRKPSIALGLLKSSLTRASITSEVIYSNLKFAEAVGFDIYNFIDSLSFEDLLGEWIFSEKAFSAELLSQYKIDSGRYLKLAEQVIGSDYGRATINNILNGKTFADYFYNLRRHASRFIDREAERILAKNPRIVGCSSTFQEHCASLALLRRIKQLAPHVITILGGGNCEDTLGMVTHKRFLWVDYVVSGEAETLLPELCGKIFEKGRQIPLPEMPPGVLGPAHRSSNTGRKNPAVSYISQLDQLPVPDYDDYF